MNHIRKAMPMAMKMATFIRLEFISLSMPSLGRMAPGFAASSAPVLSLLIAPQALASIMGELYRKRLEANRPIQLNMMDVITSLTLNSALHKPGIAPHSAPPAMASSRHRYQGSCHSIAPTRANTAPTVYWPVAPMLNRPVLKAKPTESPVISRGAAV